MSVPRSRTCPRSGVSRPRITLRSTVFPLPLSPSSVIVSPRSDAQVRRPSGPASRPKARWTSRTSIAGSSAGRGAGAGAVPWGMPPSSVDGRAPSKGRPRAALDGPRGTAPARSDRAAAPLAARLAWGRSDRARRSPRTDRTMAQVTTAPPSSARPSGRRGGARARHGRRRGASPRGRPSRASARTGPTSSRRRGRRRRGRCSRRSSRTSSSSSSCWPSGSRWRSGTWSRPRPSARSPSSRSSSGSSRSCAPRRRWTPCGACRRPTRRWCGTATRAGCPRGSSSRAT